MAVCQAAHGCGIELACIANDQKVVAQAVHLRK
jgi:hypothetical protein